MPLVVLLWWLVRRHERLSDAPWTTRLAPHLLTALTVNRDARGGIRPVDAVAVSLVLGCLAAAGPTWQRVPNPFVADTAPLVVALEVSATMQANDVLPTRLERAKLKVLELIRRRAGGRTALVAFAGSAHLVMPPSEDPELIKPFLEALAPEIMPRAGDSAIAAVAMAHDLLRREDTPGSVLLITDGLRSTDLAALRDYGNQPDAVPIVVLVLGTERGGVARRADGSVVTGADEARLNTGLDEAALDRLGRLPGLSLIRATGDQADLNRVQRRVARNLEDALAGDRAAAWIDQGWWLLWPGALLTALWFRRGWTMQWGWLVAVGLSAPLVAPPATADVSDWFFTPDQQGRLAFERKEYAAAADTFEDPLWKGLAAYRAGRYQDAAEHFARVPTALGFFNLGTAYVKAREYDRAVLAFEQAVAEAPDDLAAQRNLEVARHIVAYLNALRLKTDTGDDSELGADGFKFDNTTDEGTEIVINDQSRLDAKSEAQWMRAVDTAPAEFLRIKFALEAEAGEAP